MHTFVKNAADREVERERELRLKLKYYLNWTGIYNCSLVECLVLSSQG